MKRYSSKEQEKHFQPLRVQVMLIFHAPHAFYAKGYYTYEVILRDVTKTGKKSIIDILCKLLDFRGKHDWESNRDPELRISSRFGTKENALRAAKTIAQTDELPFDLKRDIVYRDVVFYGDERSCLICRGNTKRSHINFVCNTCERDAERGRNAILNGEFLQVMINPSDIVRDSFDDDLRKQLNNALFLLTNQRVVSSYKSQIAERFVTTGERLDYIKTYGFSRTSNWKRIDVTQEQFEGLCELASLIDRLYAQAFAEGERKGNGFLLKLANNELTTDDLEIRKGDLK